MLPPITELLHCVAEGDREAFDEIFGALYPELRRIAHARLHEHGRYSHLGTTSLVHESFLRLVQSARLQLASRHHFFALASRAMRLIVIDELRSAHAARRGAGQAPVTLGDDESGVLVAPLDDSRAEDLHEALRELERLDPEVAEVADMRWFGGFAEAEIAQLQGVTERTVRRRWDKARAFLVSALDGDAAAP
jgi:RNA polymerase sigma factor (TIGR02999 family)